MEARDKSEALVHWGANEIRDVSKSRGKPSR